MFLAIFTNLRSNCAFLWFASIVYLFTHFLSFVCFHSKSISGKNNESNFPYSLWYDVHRRQSSFQCMCLLNTVTNSKIRLILKIVSLLFSITTKWKDGGISTSIVYEALWVKLNDSNQIYYPRTHMNERMTKASLRVYLNTWHSSIWLFSHGIQQLSFIDHIPHFSKSNETADRYEAHSNSKCCFVVWS